MASGENDADGSSAPREVYGVSLDAQTRCAHYHGALDVIAIKAPCCGEYYACKDCHDAVSGHALAAWPEDRWNEKAVLCGACRAELTIAEYLLCEYSCPSCAARFNPACATHHHFYFAGGGMAAS